MRTVTRVELEEYLHKRLQLDSFQDYCPNGLQVQGKSSITRILCGVTASLSLLEYAVSISADAVIVHHGFFWKSEQQELTGLKHKRIQTLLQHNINLFAYHLPLDADIELGNNTQLAHQMGWQIDKRCGQYGLLTIGHVPVPITVEKLAYDINVRLQRQPLVLGTAIDGIKKIGWCTGAAQNLFISGIKEGIDVYVTGEVSESQYWIAKESGVVFVSAGHHATERYGIQALAKHLQGIFGCECIFHDINNPV